VRIPFVKKKLDKEAAKATASFISNIKKARNEVTSKLPQKGMRDEILLRRMEKEGKSSASLVRQGKMTGAVYISE